MARLANYLAHIDCPVSHLRSAVLKNFCLGKSLRGAHRELPERSRGARGPYGPLKCGARVVDRV